MLQHLSFNILWLWWTFLGSTKMDFIKLVLNWQCFCILVMTQDDLKQIFPSASNYGKLNGFWQTNKKNAFFSPRLHTCMYLQPSLKSTWSMAAQPFLHSPLIYSPKPSVPHLSLWRLTRPDPEGTGRRRDKPQTTPSTRPWMSASLPSTSTTWGSKLWWSGPAGTRQRPCWKTTSSRKEQKTGIRWRSWINSLIHPQQCLKLHLYSLLN